MPAIVLPDGFHYVGAALGSTFMVTAFQAIVVTRWREKSGIKYPQLYAEKEEAAKNVNALKFNCAQRAHQNTLENISQLIASTVLVGLKYPVLAATACGIYSLTRIPYTLGYTSGNPDKRNGFLPALGSFSLISLMFSSVYIYGRAAVTGQF